MNSRSLFGAIALSPLMAVTAFAKEDNKQDAPDSGSCALTLQKQTKRDGTIMNLHSSTISLGSIPQYDPSKQVSMAVGNDGNLWLKTANGEWKRVVTE